MKKSGSARPSIQIYRPPVFRDREQVAPDNRESNSFGSGTTSYLANNPQHGQNHSSESDLSERHEGDRHDTGGEHVVDNGANGGGSQDGGSAGVGGRGSEGGRSAGGGGCGSEGGCSGFAGSGTEESGGTNQSVSNKVVVCGAPVLEASHRPVRGRGRGRSLGQPPDQVGPGVPVGSDLDAHTLPHPHSSPACVREEETDGGYNFYVYPDEIVPYLRTAVIDPGSVDRMVLGEIGKVILNKCMNEAEYSEEGVRLCKDISKKDAEGSFKLTIIACLQQLYGEREKYRQINKQYFISYIMLLRNLYRVMKVGEGSCPLSARSLCFYHYLKDVCAQMLWDHLYDCLLAIVKCSLMYHEDEVVVKCLSETLIEVGTCLDADCTSRMNGLLTAIRDAFLNQNTPGWTKLYFLKLIELRSCKWQLTEQAMAYYEQEGMSQ